MGRPLARPVRIAVLIAIGIRSIAGATDPGTLTLADLVSAARAQNPQIAMARARARAAGAMPAQARAYDDPVVSWESWNFPDSWDVGRADNNIFRLSQKIPFPGKRTLAGEVARHDADATDADASTVELDVVVAVKRAYWDLWMRHQRALVYERERSVVVRYARLTETKYALGEVPQPDVLRAQVEVTHAINRTSTEAIAIDAARAELNALLSRAPDAPLGTPEDLTPRDVTESLETLVDLAIAHRPEVAAQAAAIARETTAVHLAEKGYLPDFEVSVGRFVNHGTSDGFGAMASMTIPLAYRSKYEAGVSAANARLATVEADRRRMLDAIRREVQQALLRVRTARLQRDILTTTHLPQAEQALRVTESAYQAGSVDFLSLVDTIRMIESAHLEHVEAEGDLGKAWADLERAVGTEVAANVRQPAHAKEGSRHD